MNVNDSNMIRNYEEAQRLLDLAEKVAKELDQGLPGSDRRALMEARLTHLEQRAIGRAILAAIHLPERSAPEGAE